ncbi:hypothetical protein BVRB_1g018090 [Beta vulgaris subsp. vulgaris]|nr:hypothetical protein BVRB_1g018090 [Beta vulgaris subsp. vulgaris]
MKSSLSMVLCTKLIWRPASNGGLVGKYYAQVYDYLGKRTLQEFKPLLQANSLLEVDASIGILKPVLGVDAHVAIPN